MEAVNKNVLFNNTAKGAAEIFISPGITVVEDGAMCGNREIKKVVISEDVEEIGAWAFYGCEALESVEIPDSVKMIGENAFFDTAFYNDIHNWDNGVLYLGKTLVRAQKIIDGACFVKDGTKVISQGAFKDCTLLERVLIPETVEKIGKDAFSGCEKLKAVYGGLDTQAEKYAKENGIKFIAVEMN